MLRIPEGRWWSHQQYYRTWTAYRYGSKPKSKPEKIFKGKSRERAIEGVMASLDRFRFTVFEHEGECRNGIRSMLCLQGHSWEAADLAADDLVKEALRRKGAERPDWNEGQWHYTTGREQCLRCGGDVEPEDQARGHRFCSSQCAGAWKVWLQDQIPAQHELRLAAYWQVYLSNSPTLTCEHCGKGFKSRQWNSSKPRFCSMECKNAAATYPPRPCAWCGTLFKSDKRQTKCCSISCAQYLRIKEYRETLGPELTCPVCQGLFRPKTEKQKVCSTACVRLKENARQRANYDPAKAAAKYQRKMAKKKAAASGFICEAAE